MDTRNRHRLLFNVTLDKTVIEQFVAYCDQGAINRSRYVEKLIIEALRRNGHIKPVEAAVPVAPVVPVSDDESDWEPSDFDQD